MNILHKVQIVALVVLTSVLLNYKYDLAVASPPVGMIVGAIDTFMIDKLLPRKGYLSFIHNDFNTIFKI